MKFIILFSLFPLLVVANSEHSLFEFGVRGFSEVDEKSLINYLTDKLNENHKETHLVYFLKMDGVEHRLIVSTNASGDDYTLRYHCYLKFLNSKLSTEQSYESLHIRNVLGENALLHQKSENINEGKLLRIHIEEALEVGACKHIEQSLQKVFGTEAIISAVRYDTFSFFTVEPVEDYDSAIHRLDFLTILVVDRKGREVTASTKAEERDCD